MNPFGICNRVVARRLRDTENGCECHGRVSPFQTRLGARSPAVQHGLVCPGDPVSAALRFVRGSQEGRQSRTPRRPPVTFSWGSLHWLSTPLPSERLKQSCTAPEADVTTTAKTFASFLTGESKGGTSPTPRPFLPVVPV